MFQGEGTRSKGHLGNKECLSSVDPQEREKGHERKSWKVVLILEWFELHANNIRLRLREQAMGNHEQTLRG